MWERTHGGFALSSAACIKGPERKPASMSPIAKKSAPAGVSQRAGRCDGRGRQSAGRVRS